MNITSAWLIFGFRQLLGGDVIVPVVLHVANKHQHLLTVCDDQQTRYCSTSLSSRISLQFSISIPQLSYGSSYKDNTKNGLTCKKTGILELQETSCKADISSQSDKEPIGGDFKQRYTQLVSKDRGSNKQVLQWTDVVMEAWQIAIHRWIFGRSIFGNAFECKLPSKWPIDSSDRQGASNIIMSNH